jgi:hypothetical protein
MSDALQKAEAAVAKAEDNTDVLKVAMAALELAKAAQQPAASACEHQHKTGRTAGEWLALGCAVCVGGLGLALGFLAVAIAACCATGCFVILRSIWRDYLNGR